MIDHEHCPRCDKQICVLKVGQRYVCPHCDAFLIRTIEFSPPLIYTGTEEGYYRDLWEFNPTTIIVATTSQVPAKQARRLVRI